MAKADGAFKPKKVRRMHDVCVKGCVMEET